MNKNLVKKYIQAQIQISKLKQDLLESVLKEMENDPQITLESLKIEIDAIDSLDVMGPRRDIGVRQ